MGINVIHHEARIADRIYAIGIISPFSSIQHPAWHSKIRTNGIKKILPRSFLFELRDEESRTGCGVRPWGVVYYKRVTPRRPSHCQCPNARSWSAFSSMVSTNWICRGLCLVCEVLVPYAIGWSLWKSSRRSLRSGNCSRSTRATQARMPSRVEPVMSRLMALMP